MAQRGRPIKMRPKGTSKDKMIRKQYILKELSKGKSRLQIEEDLKKKWGICDATVSKDFKAAFEQLTNYQDNFNNHIRAVIMNRYELLWQKALEDGDVKTATSILKQMIEALGLNKESKELTIKTDDSFEITFK